MIGSLLFLPAFGPIEGLGWRGTALAQLQRRLILFASGFVLGRARAIWQLPTAFADDPPLAVWSIQPVPIGATTFIALMKPMARPARRFLLRAARSHVQHNAPMWPDGPSWEMALYVAVAAVVAALPRQGMTLRGEGVTGRVQPLPPPRRLTYDIAMQLPEGDSP